MGARNTAAGKDALKANTTGNYNTANGYGALRANTTGSRNTASGRHALYLNATGSNNTASGQNALATNSDGTNNTASGDSALQLNTIGSLNTASGVGALRSNTTGDRNTAMGQDALKNSTGERNTALGSAAGVNATTGSDNIFIGNLGVAGDAAPIKIGTGGTHTKAYVAGISGVTVANSSAVLIDTVTGQLGTVSSSRRYKEDIDDMAAASARLLALRPVTFRYKKESSDGEKPIQFGLIAEEVAEVFPELVVYNQAGEPETVKYHLLSSLLLNELQKLASDAADQALTVAAQAREIERLQSVESRLAALETRVFEFEPLEARLESP